MYTPLVPLSGIGGWKFLQRTEARQQELFNKSPDVQRNIEHFKENIANAKTAEDLVKDRRLMQVALGAFGLDDDLDKKAFIQKMLEGGTEEKGALALRFVDPRYRELSEAFGYGNKSGAQVGKSDFASKIIKAYKSRQFEVAVGNADNDLRMAMTFKREIAKVLKADMSDNAAWFSLMGNKPVRMVLEKAFGFPTSFGTLDLDRQRSDFKSKASRMLGSSGMEAFKDPKNVEKVIKNFLIRSQIENGLSGGAAVRGSAALMMLQTAPVGGGNLLISSF